MGLTLEEAQPLTGHLVMVGSREAGRPHTARLIRVVNQYTAHVQPGGHKKIETVRLSDLNRHEKSEHVTREHRAAHERTRVGASAKPTMLAAVIVNIRLRQFWCEQSSAFTSHVGNATVFESTIDAANRRGRLLHAGNAGVLAPDEVAVVTTNRAHDLVIDWAKQKPETKMIALAAPEPRIAEQPGDRWVDAEDLGSIARPRFGVYRRAPIRWACEGKIPRAAIRRTEFRRGVFKWQFNVSELERCGWMKEALEIDAALAEGRASAKGLDLRQWGERLDDVLTAFVPEGADIAAREMALKQRGVPCADRGAAMIAPAQEVLAEVAASASERPVGEQTITVREAEEIARVADKIAQPPAPPAEPPKPTTAEQPAPKPSKSPNLLAFIRARREEAEAEAMLLEARASRVRAEARWVEERALSMPDGALV